MHSRKHAAAVSALLSCGLFFGGIAAQVSTNLIGNPEFDKKKNGWGFKGYNGAAYTAEVVGGHLLSGENALLVKCLTGGASPADIEVTQTKTLQQGRIYRMGFMALSNRPRAIRIALDEYTGEKRTVWQSDSIVISATPGHYGPYEFRCTLPDASYKFKFALGGMDNVDVTIDSVYMTMTDDPEHFRPEELYEYHHHPYQDLSLPYRWFAPANQEPSMRYPLVLALHGAGERGSDNELPISVHRIAFTWSDSANQAVNPCFVLVPQCPLNDQWVNANWSNGTYDINVTMISKPMAASIDLLDSLIRVFPIDTTRMYVTGLSMGGYGSFDAIMRYPNRFAAAVPMSGAGDSSSVDLIMDVPVWDFHGDVDTVVPTNGSRQMMEAFEKAGRAVVYTECHDGVCAADPVQAATDAVAAGATLIYTEEKGIGHGPWAPWYDMPQLHEWLFSQSLDKRTGITSGNPVDLSAAEFTLSQNYPNPFNPSTRIQYSLAEKAKVAIDILDARGRRVDVLMDGTQEAGSHTAVFDASGRPTGTYFARLVVNGRLMTKRMILVR